VKHLCDVRLLQSAAPSILGPFADVLDGLAEALGDHHDLAVLVQRLESDRMRFGGPGPVYEAVTLAREEENELRTRASRLGATIYAEGPQAFQRRVVAYRDIAARRGPEGPTGGLAVITGSRTPDDHLDVETRSA
jgi:hypothetical protein